MRRDLGDGLVLRLAEPTDAGELIDFNAAILGDDEVPGPFIADWTRDLFELPHPTFRLDQGTVVEDTTTGRIVSALFLIAQVWSYAGVQMAVGQPELIGTHADYRRRGLVRAQFEVVHERSAASGHMWQYIGGIPWYYRQFGYSYALDLPARPVWWLSDRHQPSESAFSLRAAGIDDVAFLTRVEAAALTGPILTSVRGSGGWELELRRAPGSLPACEVLIVERGEHPIGYVVHDRILRDETLSVRAWDLLPDQNWIDPMPAMLDYFRGWVRRDPGGRGVRFALPMDHPALRSASTRLGRGAGGGYGIYVRIPDLIAFVTAITPVLEARVAASPVVGFSGIVNVDLYTCGLRFTFEGGRLTTVEQTASSPHDSDVSLPLEDFRHLVLGNRDLMELERTTADFLVNTDIGAAVLEALFPHMRLYPWEMG